MLIASFIILLVAQASSAQSTNLTLDTPIDHGDNLYCTPTNWYDIAVFFLGNYISHALTIKAYPGEATTSVLIAAFGALLIPTTGLMRGINAIARNAKFKRRRFWSALFRDPDYQTAAAAGALCMVVRKKSWKPYPGDKLSNIVLRDELHPKSYSKSARRQRALDEWFKVPIWFEGDPMSEISRLFFRIPTDTVPRTRQNDAPEPLRSLKVYRGPWTEERGRYWVYTDTFEQYVHPSKTVQGLYDFKDQAWSYALAHVPRDAIIKVNRCESITPGRLESTGIRLSDKTSVGSVQTVQSLQESQTPSSPTIAASYSIPKAVIAIVQLGYATVTLYQSRGNQIEHYGYAAFALTVIPYAIMSLINLLGNMLTPDYQALYLVGSDVMDEAIQRGCQFDGVVGRLVQDTEDTSATSEVLLPGDAKDSGVEFSYKSKEVNKILSVSVVDYSSPPLPKRERRKCIREKVKATCKDFSACVFIPSCAKFRRLDPHSYSIEANRWQMTPQGSFSFSSQKTHDWRMILCFLNAGLILGIIGAVTGYHTGKSTLSEQGWILHWYIFGAIYSGFAIWDVVQRRPWPEPDMGAPLKHDTWWMLVPLVLYGIPAIGGFVAVIQELFDWGTCTFY